MATSSSQPSRLSDEQLVELIELTKGADSVELKLTAPDSERGATMTALGMDPLEAQIRQVYFFDTPDLRLNQDGLVVRARRVQGRGDDSVVKLRPVIPAELPKDVRKSKNMVVEVDAMPGGFVCSASMKAALPATSSVKAVAAGEQPIRKLFTKEQRSFFSAHAPVLGLDELSILGPITVFKLKFSPPELSRRMVAELWFYPDGERILELSAKSVPSEAFQAATELRAFLFKRGVNVSGEQQTKTSTALKYFAEKLETPSPA